MCQPCNNHEQFSDMTLREMHRAGLIQIEGVCWTVHPSKMPQFTQTREQDQHAAAAPPKRARSAPPVRPAPLEIQQPKKKRSRRAIKKGRRTQDKEGFDNTIDTFLRGEEVKDEEAMNRSILQALAGTKDVTINPVGRSKATVSKMKTTAAKIVNGVARIAGAEGLTSATDYRNIMVANAFKKKATLEAADAEPPQAPTADATATEAAAFAIATKDEQEQRNKVAHSLLENYAGIIKDNMSTPQERRPYVALFAQTKGMSRTMAEEAIGIKIIPNEWRKARLHALWPGTLKPAPKTKTFRQRVSTDQLQFLLNFLDSPGNLQRYAFGSKLLNVAEGTSGSKTVEIDRVDRLKKVEKISVEYIMGLDAQMNGAAVDNQEDLGDNRCTCCEALTKRQCRLKHGHVGNHKYTASSSLSVTTVRNLVKSLTGDEIKRLSGLDDTKVLKGRDNFRRMKTLAGQLCTHIEQRDALISRVDDDELFYLTDFQNHLKRDGEQKCCCLTCGFCEEGTKRDGVFCGERHSHDNCCEKCSESYAIIEELRDHFENKQVELAARGGSPKERQQLDNMGAELDDAVTDLTEYRSHLARHKAEADFDTNELNSMADDTALVISDFKMKILSCFFRENQLKFFGKRGTSCLGFMIITNSDDPIARANGIKEVEFVMMFTDDALQDVQSVAAAKHEIYTNHLPAGVKKVQFHSDGAGCFKAAYHKAVQPMWKHWTGIEETVNRVTPAGGGKSALDGMFGRMNTTLKSAVDEGGSHYDARTACEALESGGGLAATTILRFQPRRSDQLYATYHRTSLVSVLRSVLNPDKSVTLYKHSGYGKGRTVYMSDIAFSLKCKPTNPMLNNDSDLLYKRKRILSPEDLAKHLFSFHEGPIRTGAVAAMRVLFEYQHFLWSILPQLEDHNPSCEDLTEYDNKKKAVRSVKAMAGKGANHPSMRQERREARGTARARKDQLTSDEIRTAQSAAGIFLCPTRCPRTLHYCRCLYLTEVGLKVHIETEKKHDFPMGMSSTDKVIDMASQPGGLMTVGRRVDRKATGFKAFPSAADGAKGSVAAVCFQKFNRKEDTTVIHKTLAQIDALQEIFHNHEPKLTPAQARECMSNMIDDKDGGLMFCWSKRGTYMPKTGKHKTAYDAWEGCTMCSQKPCECNGILLPEGTINSFFGSLAATQKKRGNFTKRQAEKEATQALLVAQLEEEAIG